MILQSLRELALREGLVDDPAFESKPVRWVIELHRDGRFRQLYDTNTPETLPAGSKKRPRSEAKLMVIPRRQVRSSRVKANFLVDNAKYVLGLDATGASDDPKNIERHAAYRQLLERAAGTDAPPELASLLAFLSNETERAKCTVALLGYKDFADNDLFTFSVEDEELHELEALRLHWSESVGPEQEDPAKIQCLVCGEARTPAAIHNQIQIRGGSTSGVPMVSFNSEAFESYGWSGNANAPVCSECMTAYVESLRRLTRQRYINPRTGNLAGALNTVLNGDTTAVYWGDNDDPLIEGLALLRDEPKRVTELLSTPREGTKLALSNAARFYCLILTGVQGRAIVRRIHTGTVDEVDRNLRLYFAAIDVDRFDRDTPLPQFRLLKSMVLNGELDRLPAELATELWLAALFAQPLSRSFLTGVVTRIRVEQQDLRKGQRKLSPERAALLHFYFVSNGLSASTGEKITHTEETMKKGLDVDSTEKAYVFGRVLAVSERMQALAQSQGLNRTVVDRFYSMASIRPGVVLTELLKLYRYHLAKAKRDIPGMAIKTDREFGRLLSLLSPEELQDALTLEEQGRFGLGYYHQRQSFFRKADGVAPTDNAPSTEEETAA
ncbi:CRISPR-associated protein, Csd1 family [Granulicella pectinivorans]|uniref:CRISPR-associated protein, Csd1 family n=1 Tax=Granulicella pectinivorans TaxID=474950 RepID=A0A1I6LZD6_9BACT|nr:type I-C CRISPR-associated protein Cas8c/Csd1 [Granulicella pectinivorans]SFS08738.1 CRISPR-associated protein, Csd1 family [Granulicella pectinivorans]